MQKNMEISRSNVDAIGEEDEQLYQNGSTRNIEGLFYVLIAFTVLIGISPIMLIIALLIKTDSKGPVMYTQERVGYIGKVFQVYKFRTMYIDAEKNGPCWAKSSDPRVTRVGRFLRNTRLDELPQFINVLKGEMSIIGPRPERPVFTQEFMKVIPNFGERLTVKPGITGWAQVNGGYECTPTEKLDLDLYYIQNTSLWLNLRILLLTISVVLTGKGAR